MIQRWLAPPQVEDVYMAFSLRALHYTLQLLIALTLFFALLATSPIQQFFIPIVLALFGGCYLLLHTGRYRLASTLFLSGFWLIITIAAYSINGILNASIVNYALIIIFTAVLFSWREVIVVTGLSIVSSTILYIGETQGVLPLNSTTLFLADRYVQNMALFIASGILLSVSSWVIRHSVSQSRQSQHTLEQRNAQLEQEILERQRIEANLRASEERYRILFENTGMMATVYDRDGRIILANDAIARLVGKTRTELQGLTVFDLITPEIGAAAHERHLRVMDTGEPEYFEGPSSLSDGNEIQVLRQVMPLPPDSSGIVSQVLVLATDITEKKLAEQRERALQVANEKNAFFTDFFSTISHDLKTPLTVMKTSLYLLERAPDPERRKQKLVQIEEQVDLLEQYIQDMLAISRLEYLPGFHKEAIELQPLIAEVVERLRPRADQKQINCQIKEPDPLPPVMADADQFRRALVNLVENAINYTPPNGTITVSTGHADEHAFVEVQDTGMGIAAEDINSIFERFYRTQAARDTENKGTGLGLAIVKKIIDMHNGTIEVTSELGRGTVFRIRLPV